MLKILITGGAGFIGMHTAQCLVSAGHQVRILDCLDPQIHGPHATFPSSLPPQVVRARGDIRNMKDVEAAVQDVDAVYHLAAGTGVGQSMYEISRYVDINCRGTANLLEALVKKGNKLRRFVLASSRAIYGEGTGTCPQHGKVQPAPRTRSMLEQGQFETTCPECGLTVSPHATDEDAPATPASLYGRTKKQQEELCLFAAEAYGLPVTVLRYFNVYGAGQSLHNPYTGILSTFYNRLAAGNPVMLYERGRATRDFIHVRDVARANSLALEADLPPGTCLNIGSGENITVVALARALAKACGIQASYVDRGEFRVGDIWSCFANLNRTRALLGFRPEVSLSEGLRDFVRWAKSEQQEDLYEQTVSELRCFGLFGQVLDRSLKQPSMSGVRSSHG